MFINALKLNVLGFNATECSKALQTVVITKVLLRNYKNATIFLGVFEIKFIVNIMKTNSSMSSRSFPRLSCNTYRVNVSPIPTFIIL